MSEKAAAPRKTRTKKGRVTDITKVSEAQMFSKHALWEVTDLQDGQKHFVSGVNIDFYLANSPMVREILVGGEADGFCKDDYYIKFAMVDVKAL